MLFLIAPIHINLCILYIQHLFSKSFFQHFLHCFCWKYCGSLSQISHTLMGQCLSPSSLRAESTCYKSLYRAQWMINGPKIVSEWKIIVAPDSLLTANSYLITDEYLLWNVKWKDKNRPQILAAIVNIPLMEFLGLHCLRHIS